MIYKAIGSILLCLSGAFMSVYVTAHQKKKLCVLDSFISLIFYIKGQVDCYSMPIADILSGAPAEILQKCGYVEGMSLADMVSESKMYLGDEGYRLLYCFSSEFGGTYRDEQIKRCDYYIEALTEERKNMAEEIPKKSKTYGTLAICITLCLAVILW